MTFGEKMLALMAEREISLRKLGKAIPVSPGLLSKISRDLERPSKTMARRLDEELGAGGTLAALRTERVSPSRRNALALGAAAGAVLTPRGETTAVAPELVDYFRDQLAAHYGADRFLGPLRLIPTATAQYELICDLANTANGETRAALWAAAAGYAAFLGWLHQDAGRMTAAERWHDVMIERAHRSHDPQLVGFALHNKAMLLVDMRDGPGALDLTGAALQQTPQLCSKVRVLALQQAAHGVSLTGGTEARQECDRLLDEAESSLAGVDDAYPWGGACRTPRYLDVQRATCYGRLGLAAEALALWDRIIPDMPASSRRDVGVFRVRQAQALAAAGEPEQAVTIAAEVVPVAEATGSARMTAELATLREGMTPWRNEAPGRALDEMLANVPTTDDQGA